MDIVQRLAAYRDYTGLTNSQFADRAGIPRPTLSQFLNGRNKRLSDDMTSKLHVAYPDLNVLWLLFGEGDMVKSENIEVSEGKNSQYSDDFLGQYFGKQQSAQPPYPTEICTEIGSKEKNEPVKADPEPERPMPAGVTTDACKRVQYIMVFYTDNSYEMFTPGDER